MQSMLEGMVRSLASALDAKDTYTCGHSSRVADLAVALSRRLGMSQHDSDSLQLAGILHDIGKIGIDDSVLKKPGALTDEEFDQIKQHPVLGYEILKGIRPFRHILPAVRHHHESWDGRGYPDGLAGDNSPRAAQILAVADSFDAMVSDRPYRKGMPLEKVRKIFLEGRGRQWASDVVDALLSNEELMIRFAENYQTPPESDTAVCT
jgi:putative nucleotidyltransferase with HDIG domain